MITRVSGLVLLTALLAEKSASGVTKSWDGGGGNFSWSTAANWNPDGIPGSGDDVIIDIAGPPITVTLAATSVIRSLTLEDNLSISSGSLTISNPSIVNGVLTLNAFLGGSGDLTVNGTLYWTAFNTSMGGSGRITITATGVMNKSSNAALERNLDNFGTVNLTSTCPLGNVVLNNFAAFNWALGGIQQDFNTGPLGAIFNNLGTFTKTGPAGGSISANSNGQVTFNNSGTCIVQGGGLQIGTGSHSGAFEIQNPSSDIYFGSFSNTFSSSASVTGSGTAYVDTGGTGAARFLCRGSISINGTLEIVRGVAVFTGPVSVSQTLRLGSQGTHDTTFNGPVNLQPNGVINAQSTGTTHFNGPDMTLPGGSASSNATLFFEHDATITGSFTWTGASMFGPGSIIIAPSGHFIGGSGSSVLHIALHNYGVLQTSELNIASTGSVTNNALLICDFPDAGFALRIRGDGSSPPPQFINNGVMSKRGSGHLMLGDTFLPLTLANDGVIEVLGGILQIVHPLPNAGTLDVATGATLELRNSTFHTPDSHVIVEGTLLFTGGSSSFHDLLGEVEAPGTFAVYGGVVTLRNAIASAVPVQVRDNGILQVEAHQNWPNGARVDSCCGNVFGGTIRGSGDITLGATSVLRGTMAGSGTTIIPAGGTLTTVSSTNGGRPIIGRVIENEGSMIFDQVNVMEFSDGMLINNGTFQINSPSSASFRGLSGVNFIINNGLLMKNVNSIVSLENAGSALSLINEGDVRVQQGTLRLDCGSSGNGQFTVDAGATLHLNSNCAGGSAVIDGTLWLSPQKRLTLNGNYTQTASGVLSATIITPLFPIIDSEGATLDGRVELLMTPSPLSSTTLPIVDAGQSVLSGFFATHAMAPHGVLEYEKNRVLWSAFILGDTNGDNVVDIDDLLAVITGWGACPAPPISCPADVNESGAVNIDDLLHVIMHWD